MAKGTEGLGKEPTLQRVVKFEIRLASDEVEVLTATSNNLRDVWNQALAERQDYFAKSIKPLYEVQKQAGSSPELKEKLKAAFKAAPSHYSQCKRLTAWRQADPAFAAVPCSWQQETLKILEGSYSSFAKLRANGDKDARPPRPKDELGFCEVQGLGSWQLHTDTLALVPQRPLGETHQHAMCNASQMEIVLSPGKPLPGGAGLRFAVPEYQRLVMSRAVKLSKFTLTRDKKKRFWVSIAYSIPKPTQATQVPEELVFLALGASHLAVISKKGDEVVDLWRPDKHWMPKIEAVKARLKTCQKSSRAWLRRFAAMERMYEIMRLQQLQNQREVISGVLRQHGEHFVIIEHSPVRSKEGKLADSEKSERGGALGLNWQAQNTGSLARLKQLLEQKAAEWGGTVSTIKLEHYPEGDVREKKLEAARLARQQYLKAV